MKIWKNWIPLTKYNLCSVSQYGKVWYEMNLIFWIKFAWHLKFKAKVIVKEVFSNSINWTFSVVVKIGIWYHFKYIVLVYAFHVACFTLLSAMSHLWISCMLHYSNINKNEKPCEKQRLWNTFQQVQVTPTKLSSLKMW